MGDGGCDDVYNIEGCNFDGGDCCNPDTDCPIVPTATATALKPQALAASLKDCKSCTRLLNGFIFLACDADYMLDGICDGENNNEHCNFDGGDCCDNTEDCGYCNGATCICHETGEFFSCLE